MSWKEPISQYLLRQRNNQPQSPIVLVGVGNLLMGDDAAGSLVVQKLITRLPAESIFIPIDAGPAPENFTGQIRKHQPGLVIFIDAGDMAETPGTVRLFTCKEGEGVSAFGHTLPLGVLGHYLEEQLGCQCLLLIIQPNRIEFDMPPSSEVQRAVKVITRGFIELSKMQ